MKKILKIVSLMLISFALFACSNQEDTPNGDTNNDTPNDQEPIFDNGDENDNDHENDDEDDIDQTMLAEEWSWYFSSSKGNTSGNVNNGGRVTHDFHEKLHYISSNQKLFYFNPETNQKGLLYSFASGSATHLNTYQEYLYFIHDENGELYSYHLTENTLERRLEEGEQDLFFLHRIDNRIHVLHHYNNTTQWGHYLPSYNGISGKISSITQFSEYGNRVLLKANDSLTIQLRDAGQAAGSTWVNFETAHQAKEIKQFLYLNYNQSYQNNVALIIETENHSGLYMYYGAEEMPLTLIKSGAIDHFSNINFDSTYVYFLYQNTFYRFVYDDPETLEAIMTLSGNIVEINIINHWIYYRIENSSIVYQVHPDTKDITPFE